MDKRRLMTCKSSFPLVDSILGCPLPQLKLQNQTSLEMMKAAKTCNTDLANPEGK